MLLHKRLLIFLSAIFLWMAIGNRVDAALSEDYIYYEDGDVVGFIGDSITHVTYDTLSYVEMLDQYYQCRFPGRNVEFRNLGADGYKLTDVLNIYDQDPAFQGISKAVILLGTNEAILKISPEEYIGNMEALIGRLKGDGLAGEDILVLSPPLCDRDRAGNIDKNGYRRWDFEDRILQYMELLEVKTAEWEVSYLDIHTPMAELTDELRQQDAGFSLTRDSIHPTAAGQNLLAFFILQAQGTGDEPLSELFIPEEGEASTIGGELTDFYRGSRGMSWNWTPKTLSMADSEGLREVRSCLYKMDTFGEGFAGADDPDDARTGMENAETGREKTNRFDVLYKSMLQVSGLPEELAYEIRMGEVGLGVFTGKELAEGIDLAALENHPLRGLIDRAESLNRKRHQQVSTYRKRWIEVMMQRASYTEAENQVAYRKWRETDEQLREEIRAVAKEMAEATFSMAILEEGYSVEELQQEKEAEAQRLAEEQARKEAEEQARKEAEAQTRKEAEEQAGKTAEQAKKETEQQFQSDTDDQTGKEAGELTSAMAEAIATGFWSMRKCLLTGACAGIISVLILVIWIRRIQK